MKYLNLKITRFFMLLLLVSSINIPVSATQLIQSQNHAVEHSLKHNPFKRPKQLYASGRTASVNLLDGTSALDLRATLSAGKDSLVNIAGEFYNIGEIIEGFKLLSVDEGKAVFEKDGKRVTVMVNEN